MLYQVLCILGILLPLSPAIHFLLTHQFDIGQFIQQATASAASWTAWLDVIISALAVLTLIYWEGNRLGMKKLWIFGAVTVFVGPSLGLPLFLFYRLQGMRQLETTTSSGLVQD